MTPEELRAAGFAADVSPSLRRDEVALRLLCAFNGVDWKSAPPGWWVHPNESTKAAWQRVADEARAILGSDLADERDSLRSKVVTFATLWAQQYAHVYGFPKGHLAPEHYDIIAEAGGRM